ncbi:MAG: hypothetical protein IKG14_06180 [Clostridia bacterium]|nr:hypothetical protein [Clostridia bacterium]
MNEKDIIQKIRSLKDKDSERWIEKRIELLEKNENNNILGDYNIKNKNIETSFIPKNKIIKNNSFNMMPFKMDTIDYLEDIVKDIQYADEELISNNNYIIHIIQCKIINYFGLHGVEESRNDLFKEKRNEALSITDFKKNLTAMSLERSVMAQNILTFLGFDSILNYGLITSESNNHEEQHAYNCILNNGMALLIDFTTPSNLDGQYYIPSCFAIGGEQLQGFLDGQTQIEFGHKDYYTKDNEIQEYETKMIYSSNPIIENQEQEFTQESKEEVLENIKEENKETKQEETRMTLVPKAKWYQKIVDFFKKLFKRNKKDEQKLLSN